MATYEEFLLNNRVLINQLIINRLAKKFPAFTQEGVSPCSRMLAIGLYPEEDEPTYILLQLITMST